MVLTAKLHTKRPACTNHRNKLPHTSLYKCTNLFFLRVLMARARMMRRHKARELLLLLKEKPHVNIHSHHLHIFSLFVQLKFQTLQGDLVSLMKKNVYFRNYAIFIHCLFILAQKNEFQLMQKSEEILSSLGRIPSFELGICQFGKPFLRHKLQTLGKNPNINNNKSLIHKFFSKFISIPYNYEYNFKE